MRDDAKLTKAQVAVLLRASWGHSNGEIAESLEMAKRTVDAHLSDIYLRLGVSNRVQAINEARRLGLIP